MYFLLFPNVELLPSPVSAVTLHSQRWCSRHSRQKTTYTPIHCRERNSHFFRHRVAEPEGCSSHSPTHPDGTTLDAGEAADGHLTRRGGSLLHAEPPSQWRQDAMQQHLYDTAIFWATKCWRLKRHLPPSTTLTHLAQCYFYTHQYARAEQLLHVTPPYRLFSLHPPEQAQQHSTRTEATPFSTKHTGAEGFLPRRMHRKTTTHCTRFSSARALPHLPASIMARSTTKDSMYTATSSTTASASNATLTSRRPALARPKQAAADEVVTRTTSFCEMLSAHDGAGRLCCTSRCF